jgi:hypothetical protein
LVVREAKDRPSIRSGFGGIPASRSSRALWQAVVLGSRRSAAIAPLCGQCERGGLTNIFVWVRRSFGRLYNTRLHLTAPRERFQMQPAVNGCSVVGIVTARLIACVPGGSASFTAG